MGRELLESFGVPHDRVWTEEHSQHTLENLWIGRFAVQAGREREFANIYRGSDAARRLSDVEFAAVLSFTRAAFEMALAFRGSKPAPVRPPARARRG
mgnify:CR=1 FL=1